MTQAGASAERAPDTGKKKPPIPQFRFKGIWRGYQQRLLDELDGHLDDKRLHVVAAPGAGKTIIGLEVVRQLGAPALVLAPSIAIRDQWLQRLSGMFQSDDPDWLSGTGHRLDDPGWFVAATYQAIHAALDGYEEPEEDETDSEPDEDSDDIDGDAPADDDSGDEPDDLLALLTKAKIATLVLDEAHHLRRAWWVSLQHLIAHLEKARPDFHIVSLTATPPYDVDATEWERYEAVCGPIDAEISIPELVRQGDLAPHQDFLWLSLPKPMEIGAFETFAQECQALVERWCARADLIAAVAASPWMTEPAAHENAILGEPALMGAMLIVAAANALALPDHALDLLGADADAVPKPSPRLLTPLFQTIIDGNAAVPVPEGMAKELKAELRAIGALSRRRVRMQQDEKLARALTRSSTKIESAVEVAHHEYDVLGARLRLVILTDYVRGDALRRPDAASVDSLGAGPILRRMIATGLTDRVATALVTGSLVVVPESIAQAVAGEAGRLGIASDQLAMIALPALPGWVSVDIDASRRGARLAIMTRLFERGVLQAIVGTAALLGEGWDAPSINALVLATSVKTTMLSNQMRGRAIRRHAADPDKTAAIWHLATIIPPDLTLARTADAAWDRDEVAFDDYRAEGGLAHASGRLGRDVRAVAQRFETFSGVSFDEPYSIANGIKRLGLSDETWDAATVSRVNKLMRARAADRRAIATAWERSVGGTMKMARPAMAVRGLPPRKGRHFVWSQGLAALFAPLALWASYVVQFTPDVADLVGDLNAIIFGVVCLCGGLWWNRERFRRLFSAGSPGRYLRAMGEAVLDGLAAAGALHVGRNGLSVSIDPTGGGGQRRSMLVGGRQHDEANFVEAMATLLDPITNPRHIIERRTGVWPLRRVDYHAVPAAISADKSALEAFERGWRRRIGPCAIHSTRNKRGRRMMLKARARNYAGVFVPPAARLTVWE